MSRGYLVILGAVAVVATSFGTAALASTNECNAAISLVNSQRVATGTPKWRFSFRVKTQCIASTGRFQYSFRIKGSTSKPTDRSAPSWNSANGADFEWTDEVSASEPVELEFITIDKNTIESTKL